MALPGGQERFIDASEAGMGDVNSPLQREYIDELYARIPEHSARAERIHPKDIGSAEWFTVTGSYLRQQRRDSRVQLGDVAEKIGIKSVELLAIELSFARKDEMTPEFVSSYARALNKPEILRDFTTRFQTPFWHETVSPRVFEQYKPHTETAVPGTFGKRIGQIMSVARWAKGFMRFS